MSFKFNTPHLFLAIAFILFLSLRLPALGSDFSNSDAGRWHRRSERFAAAIKKLDFKETYQHYQPGVTLMWINSAVKQGGFWYQLRYTDAPKTLENADWFPVIDGVSKRVLVIILFVLLIFQFSLINRIFGLKPATLYVFFVAVEPYLIGIDRFFHLTSLETYLLFTSFLSLLYWSLNYVNQRYLYFAAVLFSLSILSKSTSIIALPIYMLILLRSVYRSRSNLKYLFKFFLVAVVVYVVMFPALWVAPIDTMEKVIFGITNAIDDDVRDVRFFGFLGFLYYPAIALLRFSPFTLIMFLLGFFTFKNDHRFSEKKLVYFYIALFWIVFSISVKKIDRYAISFLLPILLANSIFVAEIGSKAKAFLVAGVSIFTAWIVYIYFPIFSAFYSPLYFGGVKNALNLGLYTNSGEYFAHAAFYLNKLDRNNEIYLPANIETFSYYSKSKTVREFSANTDFVVVSINRLDRVPSTCVIPMASFGSKLFKEVFIFKC